MLKKEDTQDETKKSLIQETQLVVKEGLMNLRQYEELVVKQPFRKGEFCIETCLGCEVENYYEACHGKKGHTVLTLKEESNCLVRQCMRTQRCLEFECKDPKTHKLLFKFRRPYRCGFCCFSNKSCCGMDYVEILDMNNDVIGSVGSNFKLCGASYSIYNEYDKEVCRIEKGWCCLFYCCKPVKFPILINGVETGKFITKQWGGLMKELFTDFDTFTVQFPKQLSDNDRICLVACSLLMDLQYFERKQQ